MLAEFVIDGFGVALASALRDEDEQTRARVMETVRAAFAPFVHETDVRFDAACWVIGARASDWGS
ncbi:hypothetical protein QE397_003309 [Rhodococcus sp. SORGH_AS 301]|nr:hypothetical protein [Rhodococcus sp. SORGH_AS_0301]